MFPRENLGEEQNKSTAGNVSKVDFQLNSESTKLDQNQNIDIIMKVNGGTASVWTNIFPLVTLPIVIVIKLSIKLYAFARKHLE